MTNCCLIDFKGMLENGFKIGNAEVESPKSIQTATAQISQIIANVASSQYGGCSADRIDEALAPYAEKNYQKHLKDAEEWVLPDKREDYAWKKNPKRYLWCHAISRVWNQYLFTSNGQTPFTSLGLVWEPIVLSVKFKSYLEHPNQGTWFRTPHSYLPKLIFTLKRGLNEKKGTPNYDINSWLLSVQPSGCTQMSCLMIRLSNWQVPSGSDGMSFIPFKDGRMKMELKLTLVVWI